MKELLIEKMQHSEINVVAEILTDAFITNPAYSIIFKQENRRKEGLLWLFKTNLLMHNHKQTLTRVIKEKDTKKIIGTYTLVPPQGVENSYSVYAKIGLFSFISTFGIDPLIRMLGLDKCNKSSLMQSIKVSEYYYLSMVVIREEYRGTGVGSYAIKHAIQELISSNPTCDLMGLTTQLPENVTFYSRLGFNMLDEGYIDFKGDQYYNYTMKIDF
ncbi:GNAT family N-acetyltransferase [Parabacteroides sp. OttesenSCG-928-G07]|nr:GNAT family N-acetyltransferase [Parabacteroides sp. OttesenSCG-928-G07]